MSSTPASGGRFRLNLQIVKQEYPYNNHPYRLLEVYITSDGYRSRICDGTFRTYEEAKAEYDRKQELRNAPEQPVEN